MSSPARRRRSAASVLETAEPPRAESPKPCVLSPETLSGEQSPDRALRPKSLKEYVGQAVLREQLSVYLTAATLRQDALDHVLLYGPPGLGKTTLAQIIAHELGVGWRATTGPVLEKPGDVAALLTSLAPRDVLFIDEIHRLPPVVEEMLYAAMEDYTLDIHIGEGSEGRTVQVPLPPFTLIGATTRAGALTAPLRDRFGIVGRLEYYSPTELAQIVSRSASLLSLEISPEAAQEIAARARGTPRIANRLLRRVRDFAVVQGNGVVRQGDAAVSLTTLGVDQAGLDAQDRRMLSALVEFYGGGPVGVDTLAAALGESRDTLEDAIEPFLIQQGFLQRTPRGRVVTDRGRAQVASV